jgi:hypothetical protein
MNSTQTSLGRLVIASVFAALAGLVVPASAISFNLYSEDSTLRSGNLTSEFYQAEPDGDRIEKESGTAASLYSATAGGSSSTSGGGFWVEIAFGTSPQPVLTSAFLKASNSYLLWDATDLAAFNSGTFTSIIIWNSRILNNTRKAYKETSHAGFLGTLGEPPTDSPVGGVSVPDAGSTLLLLGAGLTGVGFLRRRIGC